MTDERLNAIDRQLAAIEALPGYARWRMEQDGGIIMLYYVDGHMAMLGNSVKAACPTCHTLAGLFATTPQTIRELLQEVRRLRALVDRTEFLYMLKEGGSL